MNTLRLTSGDAARAAQLLRAGKLAALPTETVYGLGADATQEKAVQAVYDAMAFDLNVRGVPCDTAVYKGDTYRKSREVLARLKDVGFTLVKPEPALLGDTISLSDSGDVTNDKGNTDS